MRDMTDDDVARAESDWQDVPYASGRLAHGDVVQQFNAGEVRIKSVIASRPRRDTTSDDFMHYVVDLSGIDAATPIEMQTGRAYVLRLDMESGGCIIFLRLVVDPFTGELVTEAPEGSDFHMESWTTAPSDDYMGGAL